jgi:hypothetical protein
MSALESRRRSPIEEFKRGTSGLAFQAVAWSALIFGKLLKRIRKQQLPKKASETIHDLGRRIGKKAAAFR